MRRVESVSAPTLRSRPDTEDGQQQQQQQMQQEPPQDSTVAQERLEIVAPDPLYLEHWGSVAINCRLSPSDSKEPDKLHSCSFIVPRQGYLYHWTRTVKERFAPFVKSEQVIWFSTSYASSSGQRETVPVPWQYPVTVVFDVLRAKDESAFKRSNPLELVVHFSTALPEGLGKGFTQLLDSVFKLRADTRPHENLVPFQHAIKGSVAARCGGSTEPYKMWQEQYNEHYKQMLRGILHNDAKSFHIGRCALNYCIDQYNSRKGHEAFHVISFHMASGCVTKCVPSGIKRLGIALQRYVPEFKSITPDECVAPIAAQIRVRPKSVIIPAPTTAAAAAHASDMGTKTEVVDMSGSIDGTTVVRAVIQGVVPLMNTPIESLTELFGCIDQRLHVVISTSTARLPSGSMLAESGSPH